MGHCKDFGPKLFATLSQPSVTVKAFQIQHKTVHVFLQYNDGTGKRIKMEKAQIRVVK